MPAQKHAACITTASSFRPGASADSSLSRVFPGEFERIQWGIANPNIPACRLHSEQIAMRTWDSRHIAERAEDLSRQGCETDGLIDKRHRRYADRTARSMNEGEVLRQQTIQAKSHDRTVFLIRSASAAATARSRNSSTYFMIVTLHNLVARYHSHDSRRPIWSLRRQPTFKNWQGINSLPFG